MQARGRHNFVNQPVVVGGGNGRIGDKVVEAVSQAHVDGSMRQIVALNKELGMRDERLKQRAISI